MLMFFNNAHDVNVMFCTIVRVQQMKRMQLFPIISEGYTMQLGYKYKNKYLVDLNMAYNGTDRFGKDNNFGFFPALAIGYAISQEDFFKNVDWLGRNVQLLKFRTSYGLVGSDVASGDRYLYRQVYKTGDSYTFGEGNNFGVRWHQRR